VADDSPENEREDGRRASRITLCVFPHLSHLIVVDLRDDEPRSYELSVKDVTNTSFTQAVQSNFADMLNDGKSILADLAAIPQQIETNIKFHLFRRVMELVGDGDGAPRSGMIGILFFTGDLLWADPQKWRAILEDLFQEHFSGDELEELMDQLEGMASEERRLQGGGMRDSLRELISGSHDGFVTMWQREGEG